MPGGGSAARCKSKVGFASGLEYLFLDRKGTRQQKTALSLNKEVRWVVTVEQVRGKRTTLLTRTLLPFKGRPGLCSRKHSKINAVRGPRGQLTCCHSRHKWIETSLP